MFSLFFREESCGTVPHRAGMFVGLSPVKESWFSGPFRSVYVSGMSLYAIPMNSVIPDLMATLSVTGEKWIIQCADDTHCPGGYGIWFVQPFSAEKPAAKEIKRRTVIVENNHEDGSGVQQQL